MAMMRTRTKSRGMCLCLLGIALALLVQPSTDFARGVPGLKEHAKRHPLHAGVARRAGAAQEDNSGQVVAEADRVLEDNGTAKETKAVLRRWTQKIYPGKWTLSGLKDELQQKLREFVEEAKAASKGLKEDLLLARQQLKLALAQQEAAQEQEVKAVARLEKSGTKEEVEKAERKVEKAERKVEKAERKVERAKKEVKEAKASGRTKESEASGIKDDPDATAFIQELVNAKPKDLGKGAQVFDLKECLPARPYDLSGRKLLTRNTTRQAWKATFELMKDGAERVAMLGIPGIGKSRSLALGLWHLVSGQGRPEWIEEPEAIVFEAWEGGFVFVFTKDKDGRWKAQSQPIEDWKPSRCEHLQNSNNWYLVDASDKHPTYKLPAKTVKACSPDREHYSNFIKDGGQCLYVEAWQKGELKVAYPCFEDVKVSERSLLDRFEQVGGTLRTLLAKEGPYEDAVKQQKTDAKDFATVRRALGGDLDSIGTKLPSRLFTFRAENGISCTVAVCSPKARELLAQEHYAELVNLWKDESDPKSRYWLEEFVGVWLTTSWCDKRLEPWMITYAGKWEHKKGKDLVVPALKLLHCDFNDIFNSREMPCAQPRTVPRHRLPARLQPRHLCDTLSEAQHRRRVCEEVARHFQRLQGTTQFHPHFFGSGSSEQIRPEEKCRV
ncbi:unnamed protein product [Effrenium voratum]|uniref:Uncharacterized protein n=1 Tax=Effrenium voratum TaxID=2562239 RepID=A0AA36NIA5_9DINO|nr:unnamed protein product [Effrenium voratum]